MKAKKQFYEKVSTLFGVASLWFYMLASFLDSIVVQRVSTGFVLISLFWWYHDRGHKNNRLFDRFMVLFFLGFVFFTLAQFNIINSYSISFAIWGVCTCILMNSFFPNISFKKINAMINVMAAILLVFNIYLMYSAMLLLAPEFGGMEVFFLLIYGLILVVFITLGAFYYLLSGSDKSRILMICSVTYAFSMLLGGITYFYHDNSFLLVLTRVLFLAFLFSLYYYITYEEVPKFNLDNDGTPTL